ncbi:MAG: 50S ribosomal protein L6 [Nitrospirota bacterium]|nr:50S ribosomal protein L6 [Nitrospirota bacterium]MDE3226544.1 50S ribosomal protein L6 [Nitrospirota bacterium]MDE3242890.1 50S ribosomal protein L6 [Nitrospirota bacterium]
MSRLGRKPVPIPSGVEVKVADRLVSVKGPLGRLEWTLEPGVNVAVADGHVQASRTGDDPKLRALHGLTRAEINNMIVGVTKGYERTLEITGVGYKAQLQGQALSVSVGYVNPVVYNVPKGIEAKIDKQTIVTIKGIDKRKVGQAAADLRAIKPPDVYKQKGIRYAGEVLRKKEGKTGK